MTNDSSPTDAFDPTADADWEAIARQLAGEATDADRAGIEALLVSRPAELAAIQALGGAIARMGADTTRLDVEAALRLVKARRDGSIALAGDRRRRPARDTRWRVPMPALAAAALVTIGLAGWFAQRNRETVPGVESPARMLATTVGARDSLLLPDGSRVVLGPLSSIVLATGYGETSRDVEIRGDAWFDVVHDDDRPFSVRAAHAVILDLGTSFAVRSDGTDGVSVAVTGGSVSVRASGTPPSRGLVLNAGDNALVRPEGEIVARRGAGNDDDVAWLDGRLVFRETPLRDVAVSMRRWYGIELVIADESLASRRITATFSGDSADRALEVLRLALGAGIDRRGDTAIVQVSRGRAR